MTRHVIFRRRLGLLALSVLFSAAPSASAQSLPRSSGDTRQTNATDSALQTTLEALEKKGWETFTNKDQKGFKELAASNYTAVLTDGKERDLNSVLDRMKDNTTFEYHLSNFELTSLGPNAALIAYQASFKHVVSDHPVEVSLSVTGVWVRQAGHWKTMRYQETPLK